MGSKFIYIFSSYLDKEHGVFAEKAAERIISTMKHQYDSEDDMLDAFLKSARPFVNWTKSGRSTTGFCQFRMNYGPDGFVEVSVRDNDSIKALVCILEGKHEIGSSGDPIVQAALDCSKFAGPMKATYDISGTLPCLLVTVQLEPW